MTTEASPGPAPTERIVAISGTEYRVPLTATEAELRQHLSANFPDIATATLQKKTRVIDGVTWELWEFVKKAGTKGATGREIAELLAGTPPLPIASLSPTAAAQLTRFRVAVHEVTYWCPGPKDAMTIDEALNAEIGAMLARLPGSSNVHSGGGLCSSLDSLPAVAGSDTSGW